jgi:hypothetical protein
MFVYCEQEDVLVVFTMRIGVIVERTSLHFGVINTNCQLMCEIIPGAPTGCVLLLYIWMRIGFIDSPLALSGSSPVFLLSFHKS